jgi:hypothetical protein
VEAGEFEHEQADFGADGLAGGEESFGEEIGIEEVGIGGAGLDAKAGQIRKLFDGDGVGDFEGEAEIIRGLGGQAGQVFFGGKV